jgi:dTMP kinase
VNDRNPSPTSGKLIAFEGIDGSGKSTQLKRLAARLETAGHDVVSTREYTDGPVGRKIGEMARSGERVAPELELQWFTEDRREHVAEVIAPGLAAGKIILTDRYTLSSVAYQGARGLDWKQILADMEAEFPLPDLALIFRLSADEGMGRVRARKGEVAQPSFEKLGFQREVAKIFDALDSAYVARVDALGELDEIEERAVAAVSDRLGLL